MRALADDTPEAARRAAVVGIVSALDVPIIIVSVRLWRTIHPAVLVTRQGSHGLEDPHDRDAAGRDSRLHGALPVAAFRHTSRAQPAATLGARRAADNESLGAA